MGYVGAYTAVKSYLAAIWPEHDPKPYEVRFETRAGVQAQVDFARFVVEFTDEPVSPRIVWLFGLVLGYSRFLFARYVLHQDLQTLLRCHMQAFEALDGVPIETLRRIEQGQIEGIEALDELLGEELSLRESRRIKAALRMARLPIVKTLAGYDFSFQPSLDRNRILALAGLDFIERAEVVHLLGPHGTGKSHIATALAVEAVRAETPRPTADERKSGSRIRLITALPNATA